MLRHVLILFGFLVFSAISAPQSAQADILDCLINFLRPRQSSVPVTRDALDSFAAITPTEKSRLRGLRRFLDEDLERASDPYDMAHSLKGKEGRPVEAIRGDLIAFYKIMIADGTNADRARNLSAWITSPEDAIFAYDFVLKDGLEKNRELFETLLRTNPQFSRVKKVRGAPGTLITYSFEKEGKSPDISLMYKDPKLTDEQWLALAESERMARLEALTTQRKEFLPHEQIAPTALKPRYLGGYSRELDNPLHPTYAWEVANKRYEIDPERAMDQVEELGRLVKSSDSFQFHVVFDLPQNYTRFSNFVDWSKQANDYLYLRGMEEGLHGNELTRLPEADRVGVLSGLGAFNYQLPRKLSDLDQNSYKFLSMGLRGKIYQGNVSPGFSRVGLELRDTTRDPKTLRKYVRQVSSSVSDAVWEKPTEEQLKKAVKLDPSEKTALKLMEGVVSRPSAAGFFAAERTVAIPLQKLEDGLYLNFKTGQLEKPDPQKAAAIREARRLYLDELKGLEKEISELRAKGEKVEDELIKSAIRMSLSEWAKRANASALFSNF